MVAGGIVVAFLFQVFVNVGMTMGIAPVTGIPLPFVTVGGSSMVANLLAIGVLQAIHARGATGRNRRALMALGLQPGRPGRLVRELRAARRLSADLRSAVCSRSSSRSSSPRGAAPGAVRVGGASRPRGAAPRARRRAAEEDERGSAPPPARGVRSSPSRPVREDFDVPYVLATDVVLCPPGEGFPVEEIAARGRARLGEAGAALAARLPCCATRYAAELIASFSRRNGIIGVASSSRAPTCRC